MSDIKIRFNTEHNGSDLKWRALIDGTEHLLKSVRILCPSETTEDTVISKGETVLKHHISCRSTNWTIDDGNLEIE